MASGAAPEDDTQFGVGVGRRLTGTGHTDDMADIQLARMLQEQEHALSSFGPNGGRFSGELAGGEGSIGTQENRSSTEEQTDLELALRLQNLERVEGARWHHIMAAAAAGHAFGSMDFSEEYYSDDPYDPDNMTYEELQALGDVVGTVSKGLSDSAITAIPTKQYTGNVAQESQGMEQCTICRCEFECGENVKNLPCSHVFHPDCIDQWLRVSKTCPICSQELANEGSSSGGGPSRSG